MVARVQVTQRFVNPTAQWREGVYVFPLPEKSAVDHLTMHIGERVIEGQIKERAEARLAYEYAKSEDASPRSSSRNGRTCSRPA